MAPTNPMTAATDAGRGPRGGAQPAPNAVEAPRGPAHDGVAALAAARAALGFDPLTLAREVAIEAGDLASRWFRHGSRTPARVWSKEGGSPVTEADVSVDAFVKVKLSAAGGQGNRGDVVGWLSEESHDDRRRLAHDLVWVIDPIDGTRAFMGGDPAWSVVVALVAHGRPIVGVVHGPAAGETFEAEAGGPALLNGRAVTASGATRLDGATVLGPKGFLDGLCAIEPGLIPGRRVPSLALRLARVAAAQADGGVVSPGAHDWDIAAADLILERAGARLTDLDGATPTYNRPVTTHGVLVATGPGLEGPLRSALARSLGQRGAPRDAPAPA